MGERVWEGGRDQSRLLAMVTSRSWVGLRILFWELDQCARLCGVTGVKADFSVEFGGKK
jgi:hypothetical protein